MPPTLNENEVGKNKKAGRWVTAGFLTKPPTLNETI